jgi:hypothetical protein
MLKWWKNKSEAERVHLMGWIPVTLYLILLLLAAVLIAETL